MSTTYINRQGRQVTVYGQKPKAKVRQLSTAESKKLTALGNSSFAEMLQLQSPPVISGTDTQAFADCGSLERQLGKQLNRVCEAAQKHGYTPNPNDMYNPTFARFEGDPQAFASQGQGLGHFVKLAEKRGTGVMGDINVAARERDPSLVKKKALAPDLVRKHVKRKLEKNPDLRFTAKPEHLVAEVSEQHGNIRK